MEMERATCRRRVGALSCCPSTSAGVQVPRKAEATLLQGRRARVRDEMGFGRGRPTAGRVRNTNDCSAVWNGKRASRGAGGVCPQPVSATSAGAEKRFELFTRNSVEPSAGCAPREKPTDAHGRVSCRLVPRREYQTRLRFQTRVLSGLTFLDSRQQRQMASCLAAHKKARARQPINGFKYLINSHGTIARDAAKKCVSSMQSARLNRVATGGASSAPCQKSR